MGILCLPLFLPKMKTPESPPIVSPSKIGDDHLMQNKGVRLNIMDSLYHRDARSCFTFYNRSDATISTMISSLWFQFVDHDDQGGDGCPWKLRKRWELVRSNCRIYFPIFLNWYVNFRPSGWWEWDMKKEDDERKENMKGFWFKPKK